MPIAPRPWGQKDNLSPIYDAGGQVVSFTEQGPLIIAAVNNAESAAYLLEQLAKSIARANGGDVLGTIELVTLAQPAALLAQKLRGINA